MIEQNQKNVCDMGKLHQVQHSVSIKLHWHTAMPNHSPVIYGPAFQNIELNTYHMIRVSHKAKHICSRALYRKFAHLWTRWHRGWWCRDYMDINDAESKWCRWVESPWKKLYLWDSWKCKHWPPSLILQAAPSVSSPTFPVPLTLTYEKFWWSSFHPV